MEEVLSNPGTVREPRDQAEEPELNTCNDDFEPDDEYLDLKKERSSKLTTKQAFSGYLLTLGSTKERDSESRKRKRDEEASAIRRASEQDAWDREAKRVDNTKRREHEQAMERMKLEASIKLQEREASIKEREGKSMSDVVELLRMQLLSHKQ